MTVSILPELDVWILTLEDGFVPTVTGNEWKYDVAPISSLTGYRSITAVKYQLGGSGEDITAEVTIQMDGSDITEKVDALLLGIDGKLHGPFDVESITQGIEEATISCRYAKQFDLYLARHLRTLSGGTGPFVDTILFAALHGLGSDTTRATGLLEVPPYSFWDARLTFPPKAIQDTEGGIVNPTPDSRSYYMLIMASLYDAITYSQYKTVLEKWGIGMLPRVLFALTEEDGKYTKAETSLSSIYFSLYPLAEAPSTTTRTTLTYSKDSDGDITAVSDTGTEIPTKTLSNIGRDDMEWSKPDRWNGIDDFKTREISLAVAPQARAGEDYRIISTGHKNNILEPIFLDQLDDPIPVALIQFDIIRWRLQNTALSATVKLYPGDMSFRYNDIVDITLTEAPTTKWRVQSVTHEIDSQGEGFVTTLQLTAWQGMWCWVRDEFVAAPTNDEPDRIVWQYRMTCPDLTDLPPLPDTELTDQELIHPYGLRFITWLAKDEDALSAAWDVGDNPEGLVPDITLSMQRMDYPTVNGFFRTSAAGAFVKATERTVNGEKVGRYFTHSALTNYIPAPDPDAIVLQESTFTNFFFGLQPPLNLFKPYDEEDTAHNYRKSLSFVVRDGQEAAFNAYDVAVAQPVPFVAIASQTKSAAGALQTSINRALDAQKSLYVDEGYYNLVDFISENYMGGSGRASAIEALIKTPFKDLPSDVQNVFFTNLNDVRQANQLVGWKGLTELAGVGKTVNVAGTTLLRKFANPLAVFSLMSTVKDVNSIAALITGATKQEDRRVVTTYGPRPVSAPVPGRTNKIGFEIRNLEGGTHYEASAVLDWTGYYQDTPSVYDNIQSIPANAGNNPDVPHGETESFYFLLYEGNDWTGMPLAEANLAYYRRFSRDDQYKGTENYLRSHGDTTSIISPSQGYTVKTSEMSVVSWIGNRRLNKPNEPKYEAGKTYCLTMRPIIKGSHGGKLTTENPNPATGKAVYWKQEDSFDQIHWRTFTIPTQQIPATDNGFNLNVIPTLTAADVTQSVPPKNRPDRNPANNTVQWNVDLPSSSDGSRTADTWVAQLYTGITAPTDIEEDGTPIGHHVITSTDNSKPAGLSTDEGWHNFPMSSLTTALLNDRATYTIRLKAVDATGAVGPASYFTCVYQAP